MNLKNILTTLLLPLSLNLVTDLQAKIVGLSKKETLLEKQWRIKNLRR